jgi:hypothetical protein
MGTSALQGYDAGMTDSDIIMRQVLFLYCERYRGKSTLCMSKYSVVSRFAVERNL